MRADERKRNRAVSRCLASLRHLPTALASFGGENDSRRNA